MLEHGTVGPRAHSLAVNDSNAADVTLDTLDEELAQCPLRSELAHAVEVDLGFDAVEATPETMQHACRHTGAGKLHFALPRALEAFTQHVGIGGASSTRACAGPFRLRRHAVIGWQGSHIARGVGEGSSIVVRGWHDTLHPWASSIVGPAKFDRF